MPTATTSTDIPSTSTTTTATPGCSGCTWSWSIGLSGGEWVFLVSDCVNAGCFCPDPPTTPGTYQGEQVTLPCQPYPTTSSTSTTTTTTTTTTTSSSSTSSTSTSSTSTSSTSSTTTTTTTTAAPCTGGCTWRWSAAGQTWLRYGTGNCSTGCSCQAPTSPGTTDGEHQTVSCGRLTCKACCNVDDCCQINCCDENLPGKLYVTFNMTGLYDCMDGQSFEVYFKKRVPNGINFDFIYETKGPLNLNIGLTPAEFEKVTSCNGLGFYRLTNCFGVAKYDCDNDVYINVAVSISCPFPASGSDVSCSVAWAVEGKDNFTACKYVISTAQQNVPVYYPCPLLPIAFTADFTGYFDVCVLSPSSPQAGIIYGNQADGAFTVDITE